MNSQKKNRIDTHRVRILSLRGFRNSKIENLDTLRQLTPLVIFLELSEEIRNTRENLL
jgi:hypothetical protein